jgi:hypothetical protein
MPFGDSNGAPALVVVTSSGQLHQRGALLVTAMRKRSFGVVSTACRRSSALGALAFHEVVEVAFYLV